MDRYFRHYINDQLYRLLHIARIEATPDKKVSYLSQVPVFWLISDAYRPFTTNSVAGWTIFRDLRQYEASPATQLVTTRDTSLLQPTLDIAPML